MGLRIVWCCWWCFSVWHQWGRTGHNYWISALINSHRMYLTLKIYSMLAVDRIVPIIIIALRPCVAPTLSVFILIYACKDRSYIRIIAISTSNASRDVATTTYARISLHVMKSAWQIQTAWKRQGVARKDSAPIKKYVWVAARSRVNTVMSTRNARPNSTV